MISRLSSQISGLLIKKAVIAPEDKELYDYGFFMLLSQLMYFVLAAVFGLILGCFVESVIFYIAFQLIRRYAGGYHAKTETRCEIMSALSIFACIAVIRLSKSYDLTVALACVSAASAVPIALFCPLDTPEKPLSKKEFRYFRRISLIILFVISAAGVVSYIFEFGIVFAPCCLSLILEAALITAGKIRRASASQKA